MPLNEKQIKEILEKPKKKQIIQKAIKHENRLRFHSESFLEPYDIAQPLTEFLDWVKELIPDDKFRVFVSLFRFPSPNVEFVNRIYNELERVFDGRNPAVNFQFSDSTLRDDWEWYRQEVLKEPTVWRTKGYKVFKQSINSLVVIDLPTEQKLDLPEPYFYFVDISNVIDYDMHGNRFEWVAFKLSDNKVAIYDSERYLVIETTAIGAYSKTISDNPHDLGICPVTWFWQEGVNIKHKEIKKAPISPQLGNLDWLLFFSISKRHLDLYAPYPIYSAYEADCDFKNNATGEYCDGGFIRNKDNNYVLTNINTVLQCPVCSNKRIAGAGSFIEVPIPVENGPNLQDPVKITSVDGESLKYNVDEEERLKKNIFISCVGVGGEMQMKEALNETQVEANFEDKTSVLNNLKVNWEAVIKFTDDTICKLRYGDRFITSNMSMGTEFYISSIDDLYSQYEIAKKNGASEAQLDIITNKIIETENRNNQVQLQRMLILKQLEPFRHIGIDQLVTLNEKNLVDPEMVQIKINFNSFVERFERENINIIDYGSLLPFDEKINKIQTKFLEYVRERKQVSINV